MNSFYIILNQVIQFFIMLSIGYLATRNNIMDKLFLDRLAVLIMRILIPLLIFANAMHGTNRDLLFASYPILLLSLGMYLALITVFYFTAKIIGLKNEGSRVYQASMIFGNAGFIGIPLILAIYPDKGAIYIALMSIIDQIFMWTYGLFLTTPKHKMRGFKLKNFANPALYAVALAIICLLLNLHLPDAIEHALLTVGNSATPLSLIYLGGLLYFCNWKPVLYKRELYVGVALKLIAFPLAYFTIANLLCTDKDMVITMTLISALPTMTIIAMFTQAHHDDKQIGDYVLGLVLLTTLFSLVTLSIVSYLIF